jgi:uncharacterized protein CbrC (UPF0167 family)
MPLELPVFRYHPDPIATGFVKPSGDRCVCCGQSRGHIYVGPIYAEEEHEEDICPWCIADGSAHEQLGAEFTDRAAVGDFGKGEPVSAAITAEVAHRTPGFSGWQQERWITCCEDAAAFIGTAGHAEVLRHGAPLIESLRQDLGWDEGPEWQNYLRALTTKDEPTAYLFRCLHCNRVTGYSDFT